LESVFIGAGIVGFLLVLAGQERHHCTGQWCRVAKASEAVLCGGRVGA
jgi:hypothetical protein